MYIKVPCKLEHSMQMQADVIMQWILKDAAVELDSVLELGLHLVEVVGVGEMCKKEIK